MGSWNGLRKYLEEDILADCLKGRVCWRYEGPVNGDGASAFEVYVDNTLAKRFSMEMVACACGLQAEDRKSSRRFWDVYWAQKELPLLSRCEFDDEDFALALGEYRCLDAQEAIASDDPLVRMFAVLDRRISRRALEKLAGDMHGQPAWLHPFCRLRLEAEGL